MTPDEFASSLTPSSETLTPAEARLIAPYFTNVDRSVVALLNLPEVVKGALFSRYSRSSKGVRRLFLDEFFGVAGLGAGATAEGGDSGMANDPGALTAGSPAQARARAEAFYTRVLSDYGDDSVGELGGAHVAFQEVSQIAAKRIEDHRIGLSFLEKSSRYVPFDDKVDGRYRYYRDRTLLNSRYGADVLALLNGLFDAYASTLPLMIAHLQARYPIDSIDFENALTGEVVRFGNISDDEFLKSAAFAYRQAVRAQACDLLRCFLPMATLTNVGVWGNGRALENLLLHLHADPFAENRLLGKAGQHDLEQVIGPFIKRANDERGKRLQGYLQERRAAQGELAARFLTTTGDPGSPRAATRGRANGDPTLMHDAPNVAGDGPRDPGARATLVHYDPAALDQIAGAILFSATDYSKAEVMARVRNLSEAAKAEIVRGYLGVRGNRRHKPGRAFEHAHYEFDLLLNIGEYRDLQRHRLVTPDRQPYTTAHGYDTNDEIRAVPDIRAVYDAAMESADALYRALAGEYPNEAQYVVPFGYRVRYNLEINLRELYHLIELRTAEQGHPDYRMTCQAMYRELHKVHPLLVEGMTFVNLKPNPPMSRLRAEMRSARKRMENASDHTHP